MTATDLTSTTTRSTVEQLVPAPADPATRRMLDHHHRQIAWHGNRATLEYALTTDDQDALKGRLATLRKVLAPTNAGTERQRIAEALSRMFSRFTNTGNVANPRATIAAYVSGLADLPTWAVLAGIADVERGAVEGLSPDFAPSAPRLHQIAESKLAELREEHRKVELVLTARVDADPVRTPEEIARAGERIRAMHAEARHVLQAGTEQEAAARAARSAEATVATIARTDAMIVAEYRAAGLDPVMRGGRPVSLALARAVGARLRRPGEAPVDGGQEAV